MGFADGIAVAKTVHPNDVFFCLPAPMTMEELTRVVVKYGNEHPEKLHMHAAIFVLDALTQAYPCRSH
jgi:hypothetical protein